MMGTFVVKGLMYQRVFEKFNSALKMVIKTFYSSMASLGFIAPPPKILGPPLNLGPPLIPKLHAPS